MSNKIKDKVSVIIRCKNEERWIGHAIQSIIDFFEYPEIIIVNNNSTDNSNKIISMFSNSELNNCSIQHLNIVYYSPGKSINLGVQHCSNNLILVMSAHCVLKMIDIEKVKKLLDEYICVWGKQIPFYYGKKINRTRYIWQNFEDEDNINYYSNCEDRHFLHNALCFYKKEILIKYPFDEKLLGKEDRYWIQHMVNIGKKYYYDSSLSCDHHYTTNGSTWMDSH